MTVEAAVTLIQLFLIRNRDVLTPEVKAALLTLIKQVAA